MGRIAPYLLYEDGEAAIDFLTHGFGFEEHVRMEGEEGRIEHAELRLGDDSVMLGSPGPDYKGENGGSLHRARACLRGRRRCALRACESGGRRDPPGADEPGVRRPALRREGSRGPLLVVRYDGLDARRTDGRGPGGPSWDDWLALAEACEQHGLEALFRSDHYLSQTDPDRVATDAWTLIGALAARTSKLRLGTLVSPVTFRHPAVVAKAAATADQVSGGRIEVGMGAGWMAEEHERFGFDFPETKERLQALAEHVEQVDRLLRKTRSPSSSRVRR